MIISEKKGILEKCPICGYRTLEERGNYDICKVCFWEDDGSTQIDQYSEPNKMTVGEGIKNYKGFGACSLDLLDFVDKDPDSKYQR